MSVFDEQQARLERQWEASTDPTFREAYALAKRAGFRWYNTESAARRMAEHAADELLALKAILAELLATAETLEDHIKRGAPQPEGHALRRRLQAAIARAKGGAA